jgi:hypothetical protein
MPTLTLATNEAQASDWPALPTETEIYILPDGRIVIADLPAELALCLSELGAIAADLIVAGQPEVHRS